jgi:hypothetical protein
MERPLIRAFIAIGVGKPGRPSGFPELPGVAADVERMRALFVRELGYEDVALTERGNVDLSADEIRAGLVGWRAHSRDTEHDAVVLYFSGHADVHGQDLLLCTRGTVDGVPGSALDVRAIGQCLDGAADKIWIILDVCYASAGVDALASLVGRAAQEERRALWFLASSGGRVRSYDGVFSGAFERAARSAPAPFETFRAALQRELDAHPARQHAQAVAALNQAFDLLLPNDAARATERRSVPLIRRRRSWAAAAFLGLAALALGAALLDVAWREHRDVAVASTGVPFDVDVLTRRDGRLLAIQAGEALHSGELFGFHVELPEPGYVGVLKWSATGQPELLYPPPGQPLVRVDGNVRARVPDETAGDLKLDDRTGMERFVVFASTVAELDLQPNAVVAVLRARMAWPEGWERVAPASAPAGADSPARFTVRGTFFQPRAERSAATYVIAAALVELEHAR